MKAKKLKKKIEKTRKKLSKVTAKLHKLEGKQARKTDSAPNQPGTGTPLPVS